MIFDEHNFRMGCKGLKQTEGRKIEDNQVPGRYTSAVNLHRKPMNVVNFVCLSINLFEKEH